MQTIDTFLTFLVDSCQMDVMNFGRNGQKVGCFWDEESEWTKSRLFFQLKFGGDKNKSYLCTVDEAERSSAGEQLLKE